MNDDNKLSKRAMEQLAAPVCVKIRRLEEIYKNNSDDKYYIVTGVSDTNLSVQALNNDGPSSETDSEDSNNASEVQTDSQTIQIEIHEDLVTQPEEVDTFLEDPLTVKKEPEEVSNPNLVDLTADDVGIRDDASVSNHSNRPITEPTNTQKVEEKRPYTVIESLKTKPKPSRTFITTLSQKVMKLGPWTDDDSSILKFNFIKKQSWLMPPTNDHVKYFEYFIEDDYLYPIVVATNQNVFSRKDSKSDYAFLRNWTDLTVAEMKIFLGLLLHTGTAKLRFLGENWRQDRLHKSCFSDYMTAQRFTAILQYLTFPGHDNSNKNVYRMYHPLADHFNSVMESTYYPGRNLSISHNTVDFGDPKCSVKVTALHKKDGPIVKIMIDTRKTGGIDMEAVMFQLLEDKLNAGHAVYVNSAAAHVPPVFATQLLLQDTYCTGILSDTCPELPKELASVVLDRGTKKSLFYRGLHIGKYKDPVSNTSSYYITTEFKKEEKILHMAWPEALRTHRDMTCDPHQDMFIYWPSEIHKWPMHKRLFVYTLMLGIMSACKMCNIFSDTKYSYHAYRLMVIERLLPPVSKSIVNLDGNVSHRLVKIPKTNVRVSDDKHVIVTARRDCKNCRNSKQTRNNTIYECQGCEGTPALCMPCFFEVHQCELRL